MDELVVLALISALVFSGTFRLMLPFVLLKVQSPPMADVPRIAPLVVLAVTALTTRSIVRAPLVDFAWAEPPMSFTRTAPFVVEADTLPLISSSVMDELVVTAVKPAVHLFPGHRVVFGMNLDLKRFRNRYVQIIIRDEAEIKPNFRIVFERKDERVSRRTDLPSFFGFEVGIFLMFGVPETKFSVVGQLGVFGLK